MAPRFESGVAPRLAAFPAENRNGLSRHCASSPVPVHGTFHDRSATSRGAMGLIIAGRPPFRPIPSKLALGAGAQGAPRVSLGCGSAALSQPRGRHLCLSVRDGCRRFLRGGSTFCSDVHVGSFLRWRDEVRGVFQRREQLVIGTVRRQL